MVEKGKLVNQKELLWYTYVKTGSLIQREEKSIYFTLAYLKNVPCGKALFAGNTIPEIRLADRPQTVS